MPQRIEFDLNDSEPVQAPPRGERVTFNLRDLEDIPPDPGYSVPYDWLPGVDRQPPPPPDPRQFERPPRVQPPPVAPQAAAPPPVGTYQTPTGPASFTAPPPSDGQGGLPLPVPPSYGAPPSLAGPGVSQFPLEPRVQGPGQGGLPLPPPPSYAAPPSVAGPATQPPTPTPPAPLDARALGPSSGAMPDVAPSLAQVGQPPEPPPPPLVQGPGQGGLPLPAPPSYGAPPSVAGPAPRPPTPAPPPPSAPVRAAEPAPTGRTAQPLDASTIGQMRLSEAGAKTLGKREGGFAAEPYDDAGTGLAIGYGMHTFQGKPVTRGMRITQAQGDAELRRQADDIYGRLVNDNLRVPVTQRQFDGLVSLAWNHPPTALRAVEKLNAGQQVTADDLMRSATVKGVPNAGLRGRRLEELRDVQDTGTGPSMPAAQALPPIPPPQSFEDAAAAQLGVPQGQPTVQTNAPPAPAQPPPRGRRYSVQAGQYYDPIPYGEIPLLDAGAGIPKAAAGVARTARALAYDPTQPIGAQVAGAVAAGQKSELAGGLADTISGALQTLEPAMAAGVVLAPVPTLIGAVTSVVAQQVGEGAAALVTDDTEIQRLVGLLSAVAVGTPQARAITRQIGARAVEVVGGAVEPAVKSAKRLGIAARLAATLGRPGVGVGDVPGYRGAGFGESEFPSESLNPLSGLGGRPAVSAPAREDFGPAIREARATGLIQHAEMLERLQALREAAPEDVVPLPASDYAPFAERFGEGAAREAARRGLFGPEAQHAEAARAATEAATPIPTMTRAAGPEAPGEVRPVTRAAEPAPEPTATETPAPQKPSPPVGGAPAAAASRLSQEDRDLLATQGITPEMIEAVEQMAQEQAAAAEPAPAVTPPTQWPGVAPLPQAVQETLPAAREATAQRQQERRDLAQGVLDLTADIAAAAGEAQAPEAETAPEAVATPELADAIERVRNRMRNRHEDLDEALDALAAENPQLADAVRARLQAPATATPTPAPAAETPAPAKPSKHPTFPPAWRGQVALFGPGYMVRGQYVVTPTPNGQGWHWYDKSAKKPSPVLPTAQAAVDSLAAFLGGTPAETPPTKTPAAATPDISGTAAPAEAAPETPAAPAPLPHRAWGAAPSDPNYLYHATNVENLRDIVAGALVPHVPSFGTDQQTWPDGSKHKRSYFATAPALAYSFAPSEGTPILLRIARTQGTFLAEKGTGDFYTREKVPPYRLEMAMADGSWMPLTPPPEKKTRTRKAKAAPAAETPAPAGEVAPESTTAPEATTPAAPAEPTLTGEAATLAATLPPEPATPPTERAQAIAELRYARELLQARIADLQRQLDEQATAAEEARQVRATGWRAGRADRNARLRWAAVERLTNELAQLHTSVANADRNLTYASHETSPEAEQQVERLRQLDRMLHDADIRLEAARAQGAGPHLTVAQQTYTQLARLRAAIVAKLGIPDLEAPPRVGRQGPAPSPRAGGLVPAPPRTPVHPQTMLLDQLDALAEASGQSQAQRNQLRMAAAARLTELNPPADVLNAFRVHLLGQVPAALTRARTQVREQMQRDAATLPAVERIRRLRDVATADRQLGERIQVAELRYQAAKAAVPDFATLAAPLVTGLRPLLGGSVTSGIRTPRRTRGFTNLREDIRQSIPDLLREIRAAHTAQRPVAPETLAQLEAALARGAGAQRGFNQPRLGETENAPPSEHDALLAELARLKAENARLAAETPEEAPAAPAAAPAREGPTFTKDPEYANVWNVTLSTGAQTRIFYDQGSRSWYEQTEGPQPTNRLSAPTRKALIDKLEVQAKANPAERGAISLQMLVPARLASLVQRLSDVIRSEIPAGAPAPREKGRALETLRGGFFPTAQLTEHRTRIPGTNTFVTTYHPDAFDVAMTMRNVMARSANLAILTQLAGNPTWRGGVGPAAGAWQKFNLQERKNPGANLKSISNYERTGQFTGGPSPAYDRLYRLTTDLAHAMLQIAFGNKVGYIDHYVVHQFRFPNDTMRQRGLDTLRGLSVTLAPTKTRTLRMPLEDALNAMRANGIKVDVVTTNPEELRRWTLFHAAQAYGLHKAWLEFRASNQVKFVKWGDEKWLAPNMVKIHDTRAAKFDPAEVGLGAFYADKHVARILNNAATTLAKSNPVLAALQTLNAGMNTSQLGASGFHLLATTISSSVKDGTLLYDRIANTVREAARAPKGQPRVSQSALRGIAAPAARLAALSVGTVAGTALGGPIGGVVGGLAGLLSAPISYGADGQRFLNLLKRGDANAQRVLNEYLNPAGFRLQMGGDTSLLRLDQGHRINAMIRLREALHGSLFQKALAPLWLALAPLEAAMMPVLQYAVPRIKLGVALSRLAEAERFAGLKGLTRKQKIRVFASISNQLDNLFGLMVYDNNFWNPTGKKLAQLAARSASWTGGTLRWVGGAVADVAGMTLGGKVPGIQPREYAWERPKDLLAAIFIPGFLGAMIYYLHNSKAPETLKDIFFPDDLRLPWYTNDAWAYGHAPLQTIAHKTSPWLQVVYDLLENEVYTGEVIRDPNDPLLAQAGDVGKYLAKNLLPFSVQQIMREGSVAGKPTKHEPHPGMGVEAFFGLTPASAALSRSDLEEYMHSLVPPAHLTHEQARLAQARRDVRDLVMHGDMEQAIALGRASGLGTAKLRAVIRSEYQGLLRTQFGRLTWNDAVRGWDKATPEERTLLLPSLMAKPRTALSDAPNDAARAAIMQQLKAMLDETRYPRATPQAAPPAGLPPPPPAEDPNAWLQRIH